MSLPSFISGVVEGFYGRPWNARQRHQLFQWMRDWGLNTYLYAPKDDLRHRARWRDLYDDLGSIELSALLRDCQRHGLNFVYSIGPGVSLTYHSTGDRQALWQKVGQLIDLGVRDFALLFDDIALALPAADTLHFNSLAAAQAVVANELLARLRGRLPEATLLFCPTVYCARMANGRVRGNAYLAALGAGLDPAMPVLWTGPEIISETIPPESIQELADELRRPPVLWDNLFANDYDSRRLQLGPYAGRPFATRDATGGILVNLNCEFEANYVPLHTFHQFLGARDEWNPRAACQAAWEEWRRRWTINRTPAFAPEELELFADCHYLPHATGDRASQWVADREFLLAHPPAEWGEVVTRFEKDCDALLALFEKAAALDNRELLHSLYKCMWDLKETAILLRQYVAWLAGDPPAGESFVSPDFRPGTFRGGILQRLERILPSDEQARFLPPARLRSPGAKT
ncbi:MAG TPA: beta-N-acetylglucosaminidase domain-containing protein [Verrucomicrobiae bacterium]|nr:beta-N-acetylglucosaminidase domain-containing protein [Verrucomicrobiae bacterium]